jgi:hypothetical protein
MALSGSTDFPNSRSCCRRRPGFAQGVICLKRFPEFADGRTSSSIGMVLPREGAEGAVNGRRIRTMGDAKNCIVVFRHSVTFQSPSASGKVGSNATPPTADPRQLQSP